LSSFIAVSLGTVFLVPVFRCGERAIWVDLS
jgi:hypothetical protein